MNLREEIAALFRIARHEGAITKWADGVSDAEEVIQLVNKEVNMDIEKIVDLLHWKEYKFKGQDDAIFEGVLTQESEEVIANQILNAGYRLPDHTEAPEETARKAMVEQSKPSELPKDWTSRILKSPNIPDRTKGGISFDGNYHCTHCDQTFRIVERADFIKHQEVCNHELYHTDKREAVEKVIREFDCSFVGDDECGDCPQTEDNYFTCVAKAVLSLFPEPKVLSAEELIHLNEQWEEEYEDVEMTDAEWELKRWQLICQAQLKAMGE